MENTNSSPNHTDTLLQELDKCPPFLAYYCHHLVTGERRTVDQLAEMSGLSRRTVTRVARCRSWRKVRVSVMVAFAKACGVDLFDTTELYAKFNQELKQAFPFQDLPVRRRRSMLELFQMLAVTTKAQKEQERLAQG